MTLRVPKDADWLHGARARGWAWLLALINLAALAFLLLTARDGVDRNGFLLGTDFISFWTAGRMLADGAPVYDPAAHRAAQEAFFAREGAFTAFFYPPFFLPFCYPLGLLPYFPALALWLAVTGGLFVWAVRLWFRELGLSPPHWTWLAAFPPVLLGITHGQTAFLSAGLLGAGTLLAPRRPWLGGLLIGLAAFKPQTALLVPLVLLMGGQWRAILGAAGGVALLGGLATLAFGPAIWADWLRVMEPARAAMENGAIGYAKMTSAFAAARLLGAPMGLAYAAQAACAVIAAALVALACWRRPPDAARTGPGQAAAGLAGSLLATPFLLDYDLVLLAFPLIWLLARGFGPWGRLTAAAAFALSAFARPLALTLGLPLAPLVLLALLAVLAARIRARSDPAPG